MAVGVQDIPPQNMLLWNTDYFELHAQEKNSKCRERLSLNALYLPKDRASMGNSAVLNPSLGVASTREDWYLSQERRLELTPHPEALSQTIIPLICSSRGLRIFPKIQSLFPKRSISSYSFTINMVLQSKFIATLRKYSFFPGISHVYTICIS